MPCTKERAGFATVSGIALSPFMFGITLIGIGTEAPIVYICFGLLLGFSFLLISQGTKSLIILMAILYFACISFFVIQKKDIEEWFVKDNYELLNSRIINKYSDIQENNLYKEFLIDKNANNKNKLKYYKDNIDEYVSINAEKVMELKMFYTMTNNKEIRSKLDDIFKDGLVSIKEYEEFKKYVYRLDLSKEKEPALLSILSK